MRLRSREGEGDCGTLLLNASTSLFTSNSLGIFWPKININLALSNLELLAHRSIISARLPREILALWMPYVHG